MSNPESNESEKMPTETGAEAPKTPERASELEAASGESESAQEFVVEHGETAKQEAATLTGEAMNPEFPESGAAAQEIAAETKQEIVAAQQTAEEGISHVIDGEAAKAPVEGEKKPEGENPMVTYLSERSAQLKNMMDLAKASDPTTYNRTLTELLANENLLLQELEGLPSNEKRKTRIDGVKQRIEKLKKDGELHKEEAELIELEKEKKKIEAEIAAKTAAGEDTSEAGKRLAAVTEKIKEKNGKITQLRGTLKSIEEVEGSSEKQDQTPADVGEKVGGAVQKIAAGINNLTEIIKS